MQGSKTKEDISISYISAECAYAGIAYEIIRHDDNSTDGLLMKTIKDKTGHRFDAQLRIQLKSTSSRSQYSEAGEEIIYKLKVKNYNDLCTLATVPIILGLLVLPENEEDWIHWSTEELRIRGCMYWGRFSGQEKSLNSGTVNVRLDKRNVLNAETLLDIMRKAAEEEWA